MLTGDMFDRFPTFGQLGKCATLDPEDIDVVGVRALTGATTTSASDYRLLLTMTGAWTLTLANAYAGYRVTLANTGTGVITATPASGTIAGRASIAIYPGETFDVVSDGTNWRCPGRGRTVLLSQTVVSAATAQIDLTRGFTDDQEITGMRIEYNGLTTSAASTMTLSGLSPGLIQPDYVYINGLNGGGNATTGGGINTAMNIATLSTSIATSGSGFLEVAFMPTGLSTISANSLSGSGGSMTMVTEIAAFRSIAITGLRMSVGVATFSTARIMQYGFRGA